MIPTLTSEHGPAAYAALFASRVIGVVVWNDRGAIVEANAALGLILGQSGDTGPVVGQTLAELVSIEQRASFSAILGEISATRGCRVFEISCSKEGGRRVRALVAVVGAASPIGGGLCLFFDADDGGASTGRVLSDRMVSLGQLAAGIAHEINNPLAYAMGNLSFAIEHLQAVAEAAPELATILAALKDALEGAERVRRTVRDLKMFAWPESERRGPVDVERALQAAISMANMEIRHRARLALDFDVVPPALANESHLAHIFLNLLLNVAHSLCEGDVNKNEIRITVRHLPTNQLMVEIKGTGKAAGRGAAPTDGPLNRIRQTADFGVALCHRLLGESGGEILVHEGEGESTFKLLLAASGDGPESVPASPLIRNANQRARVLVVDDEPRIGSAIARILDPAHEVVAVYTARDAIARLERGEKYDVILCDILMPEMSGYDLYRALQAIAPEIVKRIIFMTGGPFSTRGVGFLDSVPNARLEKPFSPEALRTLIQRSLA